MVLYGSKHDLSERAFSPRAKGKRDLCRRACGDGETGGGVGGSAIAEFVDWEIEGGDFTGAVN